MAISIFSSGLALADDHAANRLEDGIEFLVNGVLMIVREF